MFCWSVELEVIRPIQGRQDGIISIEMDLTILSWKTSIIFSIELKVMLTLGLDLKPLATAA